MSPSCHNGIDRRGPVGGDIDMKTTLLAAAAVILAVSGQADAQTYYSRTKLAGLKTPAQAPSTGSPSTPTPTPAPAPSYTYTPTYGAYSACSGGGNHQNIEACRRSDGQFVAVSQCTAAGHPAVVYSTCVTYTQEVWGLSACNIDPSRPNQRIRSQGCRGSDGNPYHAANCGLVEEQWIPC